jgi:hypothetical protein
MSMIIAALAAALAAEPAAPAVQPPQASAATAASADPVVCRGGVNSTGSHMRVRPVCLRKSEWAERERDDRKLIGKIQGASQVGNKTPGTAH